MVWYSPENSFCIFGSGIGGNLYKRCKRHHRSITWSILCLTVFKLYYRHWLVGACVLIICLALLYGTYVPDWQFTVHDKDSADYGKVFNITCGAREKLDPPCNAIGSIDREVLGINHMYHHPAWRPSKCCRLALKIHLMRGLCEMMLLFGVVHLLKES